LLKDENIDPDRVDIILHNTQLKKLIIKRIKDFNVSPLRLTASTGVKYDDLRLWLITDSVNTKYISHYEVLRVCALLKVKLRVQLIIEDKEVSPAITTKQRYDREKSDRVSEQNQTEITGYISEVTGVNANSFRVNRVFGENDGRNNLGGGEAELPQGNKAHTQGVEKSRDTDKDVPKRDSGNMDTRYEIWRQRERGGSE
jgi:hypothetical protein